MLEKNSFEFGFWISHGGLPMTASNPDPAPTKTSGNSSSQ